MDPKRFVAVIPARSQSKRVPNKNFRPLCGRSLVARAVDQATSCPEFCEIVISTDNRHLLTDQLPHDSRISIHERSSSSSTDEASSVAVIREVARDRNWAQEIIVLLQPTSPLRTAHQIQEALRIFQSGSWKSVVSVKPIEPTAALALRVQSGVAEFLFPEALKMRSQDLNLFALNGAIYVIGLPDLLMEESFFARPVGVLTMSPLDSLDIDTPEDWEKAERVLRTGEL